MRKIAMVTGTRAEYGLLKPIIQRILDDNTLSLNLIVTGTHLSKKFGYTIQDIINDKIPVKNRIEAFPETDSGYAMAKAVSKLLKGLVEVFMKDRPDIIVILGDRGEPLAAAIAGIYSNIPVAHIHGGEVSGSVDESVRHSISKLAHIHFPATKLAAERLVKMGEEKKRIFVVGAPGLDTILSEKFLDRITLGNELGLKLENDYLVVLQHSVTTEFAIGEAAKSILSTLKAISRLKMQTIILYPNSDVGGREMITEIERYQEKGHFCIFKNLPSHLYHSLLKHASLLIGNSSSGIIEAPSFNLPVINIGTRQNRRERAENVITVQQNTDEIYKQAKHILTNQTFRKSLQNVKNPYGNGTASENIVKILKKIDLSSKLLQKTITY